MWDNEIKHQKEGFLRGIQNSCPVTSIVMDNWVEKLGEIGGKMDSIVLMNTVCYENLEIYLIENYVDDISTALEALREGQKMGSRPQRSQIYSA